MTMTATNMTATNMTATAMTATNNVILTDYCRVLFVFVSV